MKATGLVHLYLLFLFGVLISGCQTGNQDVLSRPNVVIFLSDDQGWGDFSISGNRNLETPNIDRLASNGIISPQESEVVYVQSIVEVIKF